MLGLRKILAVVCRSTRAASWSNITETTKWKLYNWVMVLERTIPRSILRHKQQTQCTVQFVGHLEQYEGQITIQDSTQAGGLGIINESCSHSCTIKQQKTLQPAEKVQSACMEVYRVPLGQWCWHSLLSLQHSSKFLYPCKECTDCSKQQFTLRLMCRSSGRPSVDGRERAQEPARFPRRLPGTGSDGGPRQFVPKAPCAPSHPHCAPRWACHP